VPTTFPALSYAAQLHPAPFPHPCCRRGVVHILSREWCAGWAHSTYALCLMLQDEEISLCVMSCMWPSGQSALARTLPIKATPTLPSGCPATKHPAPLQADENGERSDALARYTFTYKRGSDGVWKIAYHHSRWVSCHRFVVHVEVQGCAMPGHLSPEQCLPSLIDS